MRLENTVEQEDLRAAVRQFCADKATRDVIRRLAETERGYDSAVWKQMAQQLGLQGIGVPEEYGGSGGGIGELAVVLEEFGRALMPGPYLSTVLATQAILATGTEAATNLLAPIAAAEQIATVVVEVTLSARAESGGWLLDGEVPHVTDGHVANLVLAPARTPDGVFIFAVDETAPGLSRTFLEGLDLTRKQARLMFSATPATLLGTGYERVVDVAGVLLAAEQVGVAARCVDMAMRYAKIRVQFGRPIGSFQAVKHRLVDMYTELELARSTKAYAVWAAEEAAEELPVAAAMAQVACSEAGFRIATDNVRVHGGIGFTWEHDAHLYFRRAKSDELLFGSPTYYRELLATRTDLGTAQ